jgi:hypothetical protein
MGECPEAYSCRSATGAARMSLHILMHMGAMTLLGECEH